VASPGHGELKRRRVGAEFLDGDDNGVVRRKEWHYSLVA
jgi:hypothetical protein